MCVRVCVCVFLARVPLLQMDWISYVCMLDYSSNLTTLKTERDVVFLKKNTQESTVLSRFENKIWRVCK